MPALYRLRYQGTFRRYADYRHPALPRHCRDQIRDNDVRALTMRCVVRAIYRIKPAVPFWSYDLRRTYRRRVMLQHPAPDFLLNTIFCKCVKGCGALCNCRKLGLDCSAVCASCHGQSCYDLPLLESTTEEYDNANNTSIINPIDVLEQATEEI